MKNRTITVAALTICIILLGVAFLKKEKRESGQIAELESNLSAYNTDVGAEKKEVIDEQSESSVQQPATVSDAEWKLLSKMHNELEKADVPIVFYGKVVDQKGNSVAGVEISGYTLYYSGFSVSKLAGKANLYDRETVNALTDSSGSFEINGEGRSLHLALQKDGYSTSPKQFKYVYDPNEPSLLHIPNPDAPVVFELWKQGEAVELIKHQVGFKINANGLTQGVNLINGSWLGNNVVDADIKISLTSDTSRIDKDNHYDWTIEMVVVSGGIAETHDLLLYQAPEEGYLDLYSFSMKATDENWSRSIRDKKFYIKARDGGIYGNLTLTVYAYADGTALVRLEYNINPNGSRNLESNE